MAKQERELHDYGSGAMSAAGPPAPDICVIALDETGVWELSALPNSEVIDKMAGVYLFDRNRHVHACEITPSYELWPMYDEFVMKPDHQNHEDLEALEDEVRSAFDSTVGYYHVSDIDKWIADGTVLFFKSYGFDDVRYNLAEIRESDEAYTEFIEGELESF